jgi:hypothetical protein
MVRRRYAKWWSWRTWQHAQLSLTLFNYCRKNKHTFCFNENRWNRRIEYQRQTHTHLPYTVLKPVFKLPFVLQINVSPTLFFSFGIQHRLCTKFHRSNTAMLHCAHFVARVQNVCVAHNAILCRQSMSLCIINTTSITTLPRPFRLPLVSPHVFHKKARSRRSSLPISGSRRSSADIRLLAAFSTRRRHDFLPLVYKR